MASEATLPRKNRPLVLLMLASWAIMCSGCQTMYTPGSELPSGPLCLTLPDAPRELDKAILPTYTIEPPDILTIDAVNAVPRSPYKLRALDVLSIHVPQALPDAPIEGPHRIEPGGVVQLGYPYGSLKVVGMTVDQVRAALEKHLKEFLKEPRALVSLAEMAASQQIAGEHIVGPDGTVTLGSYGSVLVVGMTIAEAKEAIEEHLSEYLEEPEIALNVYAFNSKVYYVITQGAGMGDGVYRFPVTGNETVLDAISQINGLEQVSSKRIWIARPGRNRHGGDQLLPVDWNAITSCGQIETNYQILPGDRVFIAEDKLVALDNGLAKLIAPFERVMGLTLLGAETITRFSGPVLRGGGNPTGGRR